MLPDIQDQVDARGIAIDHVGVSAVRYPVLFRDGSLEQSGIASCELTVTLPEIRRGTHMSRMIELIHDHAREFDPREMPTILKSAAGRLDVDSVRLSLAMALAVLVTSPASKKESWQAADVEFVGALIANTTTVTTTVTTDVTSLCPCSKAISDYGAHNQRSSVSLSTHGEGDAPYPLAVKSSIDLIRGVGSCPVHPLVKRPDERLITMAAYDRPVFVEDISRDLSLECRQRRIPHDVAVRSIESIHSHDAVARVSWPSRAL
jgi:GTP cyclohydrolase IB